MHVAQVFRNLMGGSTNFCSSTKRPTLLPAFLCLFVSLGLSTSSYEMLSRNGEGEREGRCPRISALLRSLVSPRDLTRSPDRLTEHGTRAHGKHWGEGGCVPGSDLSSLARTLQSREENERERQPSGFPSAGHPSGKESLQRGEPALRDVFDHARYPLCFSWWWE